MFGVGIDMWSKVGEGVRYPVYILILVSLLLFSGLAHAEDNSKWCGLMINIYGACSPQLIDNYLAHTQVVAKPSKPIPRTIVPTSSNAMVLKVQKPPDESRLACLDKLYIGKKFRIGYTDGKPYGLIYEPSSDVWRAVKGVCS